jgi:cobalt-zinc-cadmium efflux system outer membrane protein
MRPLLVPILVSALAVGACASNTPVPLPPPPPRSGGEAVGTSASVPPVEEPDGGPLTLRTALALTLLRSPALAAASADARAAEARRLGAGLLPEPSLSLTRENTGGSLGGASETTLVLSQLVELGGKRAARVAGAAAEAGAAAWEAEAARLDELAGTARDFVRVLEAQARLALAEEREVAAGEVLRVSVVREEAGSSGPIDTRRARIEAATAAVERDGARAALAAARTRLASHWAAATPRFAEAVGEPPAAAAVPSEEALVALLDRHPTLARLDAEVEAREAEVSGARAARIPDVTLAAGRRRFDATGDHAYVFEVSLPLPIFGSARGAGAEASARLSAARARRNAAFSVLRSELAAARTGLEAAAREASALAANVLPEARGLLDAVTERYLAGKVGLLELLDARRTWAEAAARESGARLAVHAARIEVESLIAGPLEDAREPSRGKE